MLTFRDPVYIRAAGLPQQLAVDSAPPDVEVIEFLKPERVQDPAPTAAAPATRKRS